MTGARTDNYKIHLPITNLMQSFCFTYTTIELDYSNENQLATFLKTSTKLDYLGAHR
jgi:hypothetical protein